MKDGSQSKTLVALAFGKDLNTENKLNNWIKSEKLKEFMGTFFLTPSLDTLSMSHLQLTKLHQLKIFRTLLLNPVLI